MKTKKLNFVYFYLTKKKLKVRKINLSITYK